MPIIYLAFIDELSDKELFIQLYNTHRQSMFFIANQVLHDDYLAEDAVHDAFLRVAKTIDRIDFSLNPRNLLLTIAKNAALTARTARDHEIFTFDSVGINYTDTAYDLEEHFNALSDVEVIMRIVDSMPHEYGTVFRLKYTHDLTYRQISSLLDISVDSAKKRIQRIKERIKSILKEGFDDDGE